MNEIFAAPTPGHYVVKIGQDPIWVGDFQTALNRAGPGDTVALLPGNFGGTVILNRSGAAGKPITICAQNPEQPPLLDGGRTPQDASHGGMEPLDGEFAFLKLFRVRHLVIDGLRFANCWPTAIFLRSVQDLVIRNCQGEGGRYFIYARQLTLEPTKNITIERCRWVQDAMFDMWEGRTTWQEVKAKPGFPDKSHFNGGFFGSYNIEGGLTIRECDIRHAFNVIRMDMDEKLISLDDQGAPVIPRNRDVAIYQNRFSFVRDNAIEPERGAHNWYVFNNHFYNHHAVFSTDMVAMRDVFYIANWILNDRRPGRVGPSAVPGLGEWRAGDPGQGNQGGKIFKFFKTKGAAEGDEVQPRKNFWSLFNSVQTRTSYAKKGVSTEWHDYYTLLGLYPENYPEECDNPREAFKGLDWHDKIVIKGMLCSEENFPEVYKVSSMQDCVGGFRVAFHVPEFTPVPHLALGGWNGQLMRDADVPDRATEEVCITKADGSILRFAAGFQAGAYDVEEFELTGWPFDEMALSGETTRGPVG